jgi:hypothetical protein
MKKTPPRILALMLFGLMVTGCGQAPPAKPPATPVNPKSEAKVTPAPAETDSGTKLTPTSTADKGPTEAKPVVPAKPRSTKFDDAAYLGDDVVGLIVVNVGQLTASPLFAMLKDAGMLDNPQFELAVGDFKLEEIERVTVVVDQSSVNALAGNAGLEVSASDEPMVEAGPDLVNPVQAKNNLKQVGLAFHNYHDTYLKFPRADGDGEGKQTGLSWRVHLLRLMGEDALYDQFHLDEPWDSDHNKTLIEKMPAVYKSSGVKDAGKTSVHVFTGKDTVFDGDKGSPLTIITDGTSNTILAVAAGADTADVWTKPGGLAFDAKAPKKALGTIAGKSFLALMCDGSVRSLRSNVDDEILSPLIQVNDGMIITDDAFVPGNSTPPGAPTLIVTMVKPVDQAGVTAKLLFEADEEEFEGRKIQKNDSSAIWYPDEKSYVLGPIASVKKMITTKQSGKPADLDIVSQLNVAADLTLAFNIESQAGLVQQAVESNPIPGIGMVQQVKSLALQLNVTGKQGDKLLELVATTDGEDSAAMISGLLQGLLDQGKQTAKSAPLPPVATDGEKAAVKMAQAIVESAAINHTGVRIEFAVTVPEGYEKLPELLKPALEKARAAAEATKKMNNLKQMGLAFHNYHDVNRSFPGAGRGAEQKAALSWRVHLLPYLDQAPLYNQFKMDEPWDSDHNKQFIEKMPEIFKTAGVTEPGKTSYHVFTGPGAPFADDKTPGIRDFTDGTSNTFLAVEAGPDTAEIWTKPGGLDFDPKNPIKALGKLSEDTFRVLFGDGSVRRINKTIDQETLRRLIQSADGEPVGDF